MDDFLLADTEVQPRRRRVRGPRGSYRLKPKEMSVLLALVKAQGAVVPREQLLESVWQGVVVREDAPTQVISRLRKALGDDPKNPRFIETIPKRGYRLMVTADSASRRSDAPPARRVTLRRMGQGVLAVLLVVMTLLYLTVRAGYEEASTALERQETAAPDLR